MIPGSAITVEITGERLAATVRRVIGTEDIIVEILSAPMTGGMVSKGAIVYARQVRGPLGRSWVIQPDPPADKADKADKSKVSGAVGKTTDRTTAKPRRNPKKVPAHA